MAKVLSICLDGSGNRYACREPNSCWSPEQDAYLVSERDPGFRFGANARNELVLLTVYKLQYDLYELTVFCISSGYPPTVRNARMYCSCSLVKAPRV